MSGKEKRKYHRRGRAGEKVFALQQPGNCKKKSSKHDYGIVVKAFRYFVANVYQKDNNDLFVDNLCLSTGDKTEQLRFPYIKWAVTKESLQAKKHCVFCSIAWQNRDQRERQPGVHIINRPGQLLVRPSKKNADAVDNKKSGQAPIKLVLRNVNPRLPVSVHKIEVFEEFKKFIKINKYSSKFLLAGDACDVEFLVDKNQLPFGVHCIPIKVSYQNGSKASQEIKVPLKFIVASPMYFGNQNMKPKKIILEEDDNESSDEEFMSKKDKAKLMWQTNGVMLVTKKRLKGYGLPLPIRQLHETVKGQSTLIPTDLQRKLQKYETVLSRDLTASNYAEKFAAVLNLEEFHEEREISKFNMYNVELHQGNVNFMFRLTVGDGLTEGRPSLMPGDLVYIAIHKEIDKTLPRFSENERKKRKGFYGIIKRIRLREIVFECEDLPKHYKHKMRFNIQFSVNRFTYRLCYRALEILDDGLLAILLPRGEYRKSFEKRELVFFNEDIAGNPEQAQAITNIVSRSCTPFPYIIFGPPGTGKTKTLVEAILQNWAVGKFQLVCASSNSAADVIVEELLKLAKRNAYLEFKPKGNILRIYSLSVEYGSVSQRILQHDIHNFDRCNEAKFPPMSVVLETRIVVGTLATAAKISLEGVPANHFSHVFVDECGHCSEPDCILAVAGIIRNEKEGEWGNPSGGGGSSLCTQLVLAGDPKQLGSTVQCDLAEMYNYGYSLLERLLNTTEMYRRDARTGKYNPEVITKLNRNYRSHHDILKISNQLFYHGELVESGDKEILNSCSQIRFLPQKNHPVIFHGVIGIEEQDNTSPSYFNLNEVDQIVAYIQMLIHEANTNRLKISLKDIGVVTPYKKQVQKLVHAFAGQNWEDIAVGSVDLFQGSEKLIIIISTVRASCTLKNASGRSSGRELPFINDAKRFNVALTRAKALLIVIGDPEILQYQSYWKLYMDYCLHLGTYLGTIPGNYSRMNKLVKLSPEAGCSGTKSKNKKKSKKTATSVSEENLEIFEAVAFWVPPEDELVEKVAKKPKTFKDIILAFNIEEYDDDEDKEEGGKEKEGNGNLSKIGSIVSAVSKTSEVDAGNKVEVEEERDSGKVKEEGEKEAKFKKNVGNLLNYDDIEGDDDGVGEVKKEVEGKKNAENLSKTVDTNEYTEGEEGYDEDEEKEGGDEEEVNEKYKKIAGNMSKTDYVVDESEETEGNEGDYEDDEEEGEEKEEVDDEGGEKEDEEISGKITNNAQKMKEEGNHLKTPEKMLENNEKPLKNVNYINNNLENFFNKNDDDHKFEYDDSWNDPGADIANLQKRFSHLSFSDEK